MPVTLIIEDVGVTAAAFDQVYAHFTTIDTAYSPYKPTSEVSRINAGLPEPQWSAEMSEIIRLCRETTSATNGYFDAWHDGVFDPSGLVKGWAINQAAALLHELGFHNFYVEAGGDIQVSGLNANGKPWQIGVRSPFVRHQTVKVIALTTQGVATSGDYIRGEHIYNPLDRADKLPHVASLTVIGPNIYEADRFATAAYAMGSEGIHFIESLPGLEAYMIDRHGTATFTSQFEDFVVSAS